MHVLGILRTVTSCRRSECYVNVIARQRATLTQWLTWLASCKEIRVLYTFGLKKKKHFSLQTNKNQLIN